MATQPPVWAMMVPTSINLPSSPSTATEVAVEVHRPEAQTGAVLPIGLVDATGVVDPVGLTSSSQSGAHSTLAADGLECTEGLVSYDGGFFIITFTHVIWL